MKILTVLPLTDNFSKKKAGAVSLFLNEVDRKTTNHKIIGHTIEQDIIDPKKYVNIKKIKKVPHGKNKDYANKVGNFLEKSNFNIIEIHNRPQICKILLKRFPKKKIILYFHNDPNKIRGSITIDDKLELLNNCSKIIFISEWIKEQFFKEIEHKNSDKTEVVYHAPVSSKKNKIVKKKFITFAGKLNSSKGYDIFCKVAEKFLQIKNFKWKFIVLGDEPREKINFKHPNFEKKGWLPINQVKEIIKQSSIIVVPSRWDEPLGRVAIEASKSGCAVITSDKGGLIECSPFSFFAKPDNFENFYKIVENLINNPKTLKEIINLNSKYNHKRTDIKFVKKRIKQIREGIIKNKININLNNPIKVLHVADLHLRHNGRLFYSTVKKLNNGFIRNKFNLQTLSDRDTSSYKKNIIDIKGSKSLNKNLLRFCSNFRPDLIIFGHADNINNVTLDKIKNYYKGTKISQWFLDPLIETGPDYDKNQNRFSKKLGYCDANFVTTDPKKLKFNNKKIHYLPNPVDETIDYLKCYENEDPIYDLFLAISHGQHRGKLKDGTTDDRINQIQELIDSNFIKINLFGKDKQPVWGDYFFNELNKCSMGLNLSRGKPIKHYSSDRIASLMGNGLLTFVNSQYKFKDFFNNNELITYSNNKDLIEKIIFFKKNKILRKKIAKNGRDKYFKLFNNIVTSKYIVNKSLDIRIETNW